MTTWRVRDLTNAETHELVQRLVLRLGSVDLATAALRAVLEQEAGIYMAVPAPDELPVCGDSTCLHNCATCVDHIDSNANIPITRGDTEMTNIHDQVQRAVEALASLPVGPEGPIGAPEMAFNIAGGYEVSIWYSYNDGGWKSAVTTPVVSAKIVTQEGN